MKQLLLVIYVTFQTIVFSTAMAWSPLDSFESANESGRYCFTVVAGGEGDQEGDENKNEEEGEEEEPDCD
ncbi:MAG: hypothetical protein GY935_18735 [Gammaproteobacteria bacterium]|nr:hypothetical protein [Gammaproteobacteria bacterium]